MVTTYERRIELEGNYNFRDLGGYESADGRVLRWRKLYRSDALHNLTHEDVRRLGLLGLAAVFDLRTAYELEHDGLGALYDAGVSHHHTPFISDPTPPERREFTDDLHPVYVRMLASAQPSIKLIFERLAREDSYPAVFHCAAGKDRTGVMAAMVLRALGVSDATIIADYALSTTYITPHLEARWEAGDLGPYKNIPKAFLRADPESMVKILNVVDEEYGPGAAYLAATGLSRDILEQLRERLLVERSQA
jgi:protein-tyrosine phosphatase